MRHESYQKSLKRCNEKPESAIFTICFNGYSISLDRREQGSNIDFISHAHSDHVSAAKSSSSVLASKETHELMDSAYNISAKPFMAEDLELLDSGHMLGSKQLYIKDSDDGTTIVYSGDFQVQGNSASNKIDVREADIAIIDSTYPYPEIRFNDNDTTKELIQKWVSNMLDRGIVLFSAYKMGKAQELIRIFNEIGIKPVVSKKISAINKVYSRNGIALDYVSIYDDKEEHAEFLKHKFVGITETRDISTLSRRLSAIHCRDVYTAVATGFSKIFKFNTNAQFALSSHADFYQATRYIDAVSPKHVFTYGPNSAVMAGNLAQFGYRAEPFNNAAINNTLKH